MLLLTSLKNTGLSRGKISPAFWHPEKPKLTHKKKRAPFLF